MEENGENSPTPVRGQASSSLEDLSRSNNIEQLLNSENKSEQVIILKACLFFII